MVLTAAVLPVKRFAVAKRRLGQSVVDPLRHDLVEAMVSDVLEVLLGLEDLTLTVVVSSEPSVVRLAAEQGALVVPDTLEAGQSAAAALGLNRAQDEGIQRALLVPGDCPALDASELRHLLSDPAPGPAVVIVPDRHGTGTNALMLTPSAVIAPAFGPDSRERHRLLALAAGASCRVEQIESLALDVDTGADLDVLRERLEASAQHGARARHTRAVLTAWPRAAPGRDGDLAPAP